MSRLHIIPDANRIEQSLELAEKYDAVFEYNDFFMPDMLDDEIAVSRRIDLYRSLDRSRKEDTLHGVFLDITPHSDDALIRAASDKRIRQSMEIARELGVKGVVFHTNTIPNFRVQPYRDNWLKRNAEYFTRICSEYSELHIYMENMFDIDNSDMLRIGEAMRGVDNFGLCLDYAHAHAFGEDPADWLKRLAPYVRHMHINDNDGVNDLHQVIGQGSIDWEEYTGIMTGLGTDASILVEVTGVEKQRASLEYMKAHRVYPFM